MIMADTEEKVNKAKQLVHNVIETVSLCFFHFVNHQNTNVANRLLLFPKVRTSSNATNSENWPPLTVHSVTMKTKLVRTVSLLRSIQDQ